MIEKPDDERLELYNQFKSSLREGNVTEFFDVDDLIAIADQAADLQDDYVQLEALLRGYRFYPDNEELGVRRGFLYHDLNISGGAESIAEHPLGQSPLWTLLRLRARAEKLEPEKAQRRLEKLIDRTEEFDDESIIQLVNTAAACGLYPWLKKALPAIRKKCTFLPALLYETYIVASQNADFDFSIKLLEELTEIEPFNVDFWNALAQEQICADHFAEAMIPLEYSLAIDSENRTTIALKATALLHLSECAQAEELLRPYREVMTAEEGPICELYARSLIGLNRRSEAIELLMDRTIAHPEDTVTLDLLLRLKAPGVKDPLERYYALAGQNDPAEWSAKANEYYNQGDYFAAREMFTIQYRIRGLEKEHFPAYYSSLYVTESYAECAELLDDFLRNRPSQLTPDICVAGLLSMCRIGNLTQAASAVRALERMFPLTLRTQWHIASTLASIGFSTFLNMLGTMLNHPEHFDIEAIDLFTPPFNEPVK